MAFEVVSLASDTYHLQSGANSGLILHAGQAIVIDSGMDDDAGKKIKRTLEQQQAILAALILTHSHADHIGGAAYLRRSLPAFTVYAPALEAAFIENPDLEGIFLSAGAMPFDQIKGKFTRAQACHVDQILTAGQHTIAGIDIEALSIAGHSPNQMALRHGEVIFTADAFLPEATLQKYPIPFTVHMAQALDSLAKLEELTGLIFAPGHGPQLADARPTIAANRGQLQRVIDAVHNHVRQQAADEGTLTLAVGQHLGDGLATPVGYYLARAAIQAALVYLYEQGQIIPIAGGPMRWIAR